MPPSSSPSPTDIPSSFTHHPFLLPLLNSPAHTLIAPPSRTPKPLTGEDSLFATTLRSPSSLTAALCIYPTPSEGSIGIASLDFLVEVGEGMNGWPGVLHGGIIATLIDEGMGTLLVVDSNLRRVDRRRVQNTCNTHDSDNSDVTAETTEGDGGMDGAFTVELKVVFKKQVVVPGVVLVRCVVKKREGRKIWMGARCLQGDDSAVTAEGEAGMKECATGEALFVVPRGSKI